MPAFGSPWITLCVCAAGLHLDALPNVVETGVPTDAMLTSWACNACSTRAPVTGYRVVEDPAVLTVFWMAMRNGAASLDDALSMVWERPLTSAQEVWDARRRDGGAG